MSNKDKPRASVRKAPASYAARPVVRAEKSAQGISAAALNPQLRRLTTQVLDELKLPDAVPSVVIYHALEKAAGLAPR